MLIKIIIPKLYSSHQVDYSKADKSIFFNLATSTRLGTICVVNFREYEYLQLLETVTKPLLTFFHLNCLLFTLAVLISSPIKGKQ